MRFTYKHIFSSSAFVLVAEIFERFTRFVLVVFSARLLGDAEYGKFSFALAFTGIFFIIADGGIHQLMMREIAGTPERIKKLVANGLFLKSFLALFTGLCIYVIGRLTGKPPDVLMTVYIIGASEIFASFADYFATVFRATLKMKYDVTAVVFSRVINTGLGIAVLVMHEGIVALAWVYLFSQFLKFIYCIIVTHVKFAHVSIQYDKELVRHLFRDGSVFWILRFFSILYTYIDSVLLSFMATDQVVGWYSAAYRLVFAMMFIPQGTMKAVFPALSAYYKDSQEEFKKLFERTFKVMLVVGFSLASLIFVLADEIITAMYGKEYINAAGALRILVWSTALIFIGTVQTHTTRASHREGFTAKIVACSAVLNIGLNFILIPRYSYIGAALATLASELFTFTTHYWFMAKNLVKPQLLRLSYKVIIANVVMCAYVLLMKKFNFYFAAITAVFVNLLMLRVLNYFTKNEFAFMLNALKFSKRPATQAIEQASETVST